MVFFQWCPFLFTWITGVQFGKSVLTHAFLEVCHKFNSMGVFVSGLVFALVNVSTKVK
jgi:hypothetical protein